MPLKNETIFPGRYVNDEPLYVVWCGMKSRCYNTKAVNYKWYGAKGIQVCEDWINDFIAFYNWSLSNGYKKGLTLDRKEGDKHYSPDNCRWVTMKVQNGNRKVPKKYKKSLVVS